jgi:hypothetical protein
MNDLCWSQDWMVMKNKTKTRIKIKTKIMINIKIKINIKSVDLFEEGQLVSSFNQEKLLRHYLTSNCSENSRRDAHNSFGLVYIKFNMNFKC